jgi:hypothetical protein
MTATTITNSLESLENYDFDFQPDMVILTFYENDINDLRTSNVTSPGLYKILKNIGWFGPIRYFVAGKAFKLKKLLTTNFEGFQEEALVNGKKIGPKKDINHIPWPDDPEKFRERSAKENFNEKELLIHYYLFGTEGLVLPYTSKDDENTWKLWKEWERHLDKLNELCKSRKIKLIIMAYPSYPRIIETEFDNEKTPENIIKELCEKKGISFIDPLPEFRKAYKELKTEKKSLYFGPADWHANKNGSEVIARLLEKVVQNELSK